MSNALEAFRMKKVVWTAIVSLLAVVACGAAPALAQEAPRTQRQQIRALIEKRIDKRFKRLDQNGNGVIDRSEWTRNARVFDRFDRNQDGTLSPEEFRQLVIARARRLAHRR